MIDNSAHHFSQPFANTYPDQSGLATVGIAGNVHRLRYLPQDNACVIQEETAGVRERDMSRVAFQKLRSNRCFENSDLAAQGRLSDLKFPGGSSKTQLLRYSHEVSYASQFHRPRPEH
jgi:hypothetical protein